MIEPTQARAPKTVRVKAKDAPEAMEETLIPIIQKAELRADPYPFGEDMCFEVIATLSSGLRLMVYRFDYPFPFCPVNGEDLVGLTVGAALRKLSAEFKEGAMP